MTCRPAPLLYAAGMALMVTACTEPHEEVERAALQHAAEVAPTLTAEEQRVIADVRRTADAWRSAEEAWSAGYTSQVPAGCIVFEQGAQGIHFRNDALVDGRMALNEPQMLLYEPQPDGTLELVAVEYIIPIQAPHAEQPPALLGRPLRRDDEHGWWRLHVWTHRENPDGMFALYNPEVSCALAETAGFEVRAMQ